MIKKFIGVTVAALVLAVALPAFAANTGSSTNSTITPAKIACVGAAAAVREAAIPTAVTTRNNALEAAHTARASALAQTYAASSTPQQVKTKVREAWAAFRTSSRRAQSDWKIARRNIWATFKTSVKACGQSAQSISDQNNSSSETE